MGRVQEATRVCSTLEARLVHAAEQQRGGGRQSAADADASAAQLGGQSEGPLTPQQVLAGCTSDHWLMSRVQFIPARLSKLRDIPPG